MSKGKDIVLVDDIIDTAGTLDESQRYDDGTRRKQCSCDLYACRSLAGQPTSASRSRPIIELVVTDTIPLKQESDKIKVLTVAELFSDVIKRVRNYESISSHFILA